MTAAGTRHVRWRWREVSPRRVLGNLLRTAGIAGLLTVATDLIRGEWNPDLDPAFLGAAALFLLASIPVLWRVKPAPWP